MSKWTKFCSNLSKGCWVISLKNPTMNFMEALKERLKGGKDIYTSTLPQTQNNLLLCVLIFVVFCTELSKTESITTMFCYVVLSLQGSEDGHFDCQGGELLNFTGCDVTTKDLIMNPTWIFEKTTQLF